MSSLFRLGLPLDIFKRIADIFILSHMVRPNHFPNSDVDGSLMQYLCQKNFDPTIEFSISVVGPTVEIVNSPKQTDMMDIYTPAKLDVIEAANNNSPGGQPYSSSTFNVAVSARSGADVFGDSVKHFWWQIC